MNLLGADVTHIKFGSGVITDLTKNIITVRFNQGEKRFQYPDAFQQYLILKNNSIQTKIDDLNNERLRILEEKSHYRNRIYTMKIEKKSQAAFDIPPEEIHKVMISGFVETGSYMSGARKGKPRIPTALQPNSAVLLTGCIPNTDRHERKILGAAMVGTDFWGKECRNGQVVLHETYGLLLPFANALPFQNYFSDTCPAPWGSVPFKYFECRTMQRILCQVCKVFSGTDKALTAAEFFRYFQWINRLPEMCAETTGSVTY